MYTRCPKCRTWFNVTEAHLGAARAKVRCGQCLTAYDASSRLWSEPDEESPQVPWGLEKSDPGMIAAADFAPEPASGSSNPPGPPDSPYPPDRRDRAEPSDPFPYTHQESPLGDDPRLSTVSFGEGDIAIDLDSESSGPLVGDVRRVAAGGHHTRPGPDRIREGRGAPRRSRSREQAILDRIEGMDVRRGRRWATNSCVVLLLVLIMQYTWFMAGDLAAAFPALGPAIDEFCTVAGCRTDRQTGRSAIRVISRTVRPHIAYASAISVNATLENRANEARPFPVVFFVLYGKDGRTVASRALEPTEYLAGGSEPSGGMKSGSRVDIAFDFVAPPEVAVSFDLHLI